MLWYIVTWLYVTAGDITALLLLGGYLSKTEVNYSSYVHLGLGWQKLTGTPEGLVGASVCATEDGFLLLGGRYLYEVTNSTHHYSVERQTWRRFSDMPTARSYAGSVRLGQRVYVIGGAVLRDGKLVPVDSCECLNTSEDTWTKLAPMEQGMLSPITAVIDEYIYVLFNDDEANKASQRGSTTLQRYHHISGCWSFMQPLPDSVGRTYGARAASISGSMYVVGGDGSLCEKYSPHTDSWTRLTRPGYQHHYGAVAVCNSTLMLLGGTYVRDGKVVYSDIVEQYDTDHDTWAVANSHTLPVRLMLHHVIVLKIAK